MPSPYFAGFMCVMLLSQHMQVINALHTGKHVFLCCVSACQLPSPRTSLSSTSSDPDARDKVSGRLDSRIFQLSSITETRLLSLSI